MERKDIKKSNPKADENIKTKNLDPEIWVDIGAGNLPVGGVKEKLEELKYKIYIGIDIDYKKEYHDFFKTIITEQYGLEKRNFFNILAYGQKTPLKDNSCHQVFLANILGAPLIEDKTKTEIIKEVWRILKPGGYLNIIECYTPPEKNKIKEQIENLNFKFKEEIELTKENIDDSIPLNSFYLRFQKQEEEK
jgi:SAM-dependent methyltransferase